jgi:CBS domain-containing protein
MFVHQVLPAARRQLRSVGPDASLSAIARLLSSEHISLVVVDGADGRMIGVISDSDVVRGVAMCSGNHHACGVQAKRVMTSDIVSCTTAEPLREVWASMKRGGLRHVPIVDPDGRAIGVLDARDVLLNLFEEVEHQEQELRDYLLCAGYR